MQYRSPQNVWLSPHKCHSINHWLHPSLLIENWNSISNKLMLALSKGLSTIWEKTRIAHIGIHRYNEIHHTKTLAILYYGSLVWEFESHFLTTSYRGHVNVKKIQPIYRCSKRENRPILSSWHPSIHSIYRKNVSQHWVWIFNHLSSFYFRPVARRGCWGPGPSSSVWTPSPYFGHHQ